MTVTSPASRISTASTPDIGASTAYRRIDHWILEVPGVRVRSITECS